MKWLAKIKINQQNAVLAVILVVIIYMAFSSLNVIARNYQLQQRMDDLIAENEILQLENEQLQFEITYYQTDAFVEREARDKLELQAPGERTVIFPDLIPRPSPPPQPEPDPTFTQSVADNIQEWIFFLFRIDLS